MFHKIDVLEISLMVEYNKLKTLIELFKKLFLTPPKLYQLQSNPRGKHSKPKQHFPKRQVHQKLYICFTFCIEGNWRSCFKRSMLKR